MNFIAKLKPGDSIGIFSPSAPVTYGCPRRFARSKEFLQSKGFKIKVIKEVWKVVENLSIMNCILLGSMILLRLELL